MTPAELEGLRETALRVREHILRMTAGGGCFAGASLSCADLLVYLYARFLRLSPEHRTSPRRDVFLLSKGHDVPALYATCAELGYFNVARLATHLSGADDLYWHPNRSVPGVEFHSGSLGHLLAVGAGIAYEARLSGDPSRVVVLLGDGELDEGSVWEALLVSAAQRLGNLVAVVDRNGIQANQRTEELTPLEPLADKFTAFGCAVRTVDGHDFAALDAVFREAPFAADRPSVVIARTVRGKGVPSLEDRVDRWFCAFTPEEVEDLVRELHGSEGVGLTSAPLVVR